MRSGLPHRLVIPGWLRLSVGHTEWAAALGL
jgi:hypothetical protein